MCSLSLFYSVHGLQPLRDSEVISMDSFYTEFEKEDIEDPVTRNGIGVSSFHGVTDGA